MSDRDISSGLQDRLDKHRDDRTEFGGTLVLSEETGFVGDTVTLKGRNLPENRTLAVNWKTSKGMWGVLEGNEVVGPQYQPKTERIMTVSTDENGRFTEDWTVREDYGGEHKIELETQMEEVVATAAYTIEPWFEIDRTEAPLGETFTIVGHGLGPNVLTNNYQLTWDNSVVGFMTGVLNRGRSTAEIRAVGSPGKHVIDVWRNYRGVPFLQNNTQSPYGPVGGDRQSTWTVSVTELQSEPETSWMDPLLDEGPLDVHLPDVDEQSAAELEISPRCGQPGTDATITGRNFPPETSVDLVWYTHEGHRVKGIPITPERQPWVLPTVTTDDVGAFEVDVTIPGDKGSTRPITAEIDGKSVAVTGFMMQPKIVDMSPTRGPVGTTVEIELTGIGWPTYENAYYFVYDNKPLGYVCSLESEQTATESGVVRGQFTASGDPGYHFIDVYPSFFQMRDSEPDFVLKPHLSYLDNHPIRPLPALHFAFEITK